MRVFGVAEEKAVQEPILHRPAELGEHRGLYATHEAYPRSLYVGGVSLAALAVHHDRLVGPYREPVLPIGSLASGLILVMAPDPPRELVFVNEHAARIIFEDADQALHGGVVGVGAFHRGLRWRRRLGLAGAPGVAAVRLPLAHLALVLFFVGLELLPRSEER